MYVFQDVLADDHESFNHRRDRVISLFALLFPPMSESVSLVSQCHKFSSLMLNSYSVERILIIVFASILILGYYMYRPVLAHAHRNGQLL